MKAYRKFKLPEAAGPPAKVANSAKVPEPETLATLATLAAGDAQTTNFDGQLKDCAPPEPDETELEERKGLATDGVPVPYLDAWTRLQVQRSVLVSDTEWRQAIDDAGRVLDQWGSLALEFGWTAGDVFEVPHDGKPGGLIWFAAGDRVRALGPEHAVLWGGERVLDKLTRGEWINPHITLSSADSSSTEPKKSFQTSTTLRRAAVLAAERRG